MNPLKLWNIQGDTADPPIDMEVAGCCEACDGFSTFQNTGRIHRQINSIMPENLIINLLEELIPGAAEFFDPDDRIIDPLETTPDTYLKRRK